MKKIRVLIVDDSALMRQILTALLSEDPEIEVVGTAPDPYVARDRIKELNPDLLTLDIEMPKMDGLTFLKKLMAAHPMPVLIVSSLTEEGCDTTLRALELGAVDFFSKPKLDMQAGMEAQTEALIAKVKAASQARVIRRAPRPSQEKARPYVLKSSAMIKTTDVIIAIGASTGGTEALKEFLTVLPPNTPPLLITQHMPERFTNSFANYLNQLCSIKVKEAEEDDRVLTGEALIAPGNYHMRLVRDGARYRVRLDQEPPVNRHRPSVDVLFNSVAECAGANSIGVILTGMGADGANGLLKMKEAGAMTLAQDEASCVVFGMPKEAIKRGAVDRVLPLCEIPSAVLQYVELHHYRRQRSH